MWAQGYATLRLDSFTARGYSNVCGNPGQVSVGERAQDVFAAAYLLAARPDVRTDRIAVLGLSHGGGTAIYVARDHEELRPWRERLATRHGKLVASVALYGGCLASRARSHSRFRSQAGMIGHQLHLVWSQIQANGIMQAIVYPEAYHSFDAPLASKPHRAYGHLLATTRQPLTLTRGCLNFYIDISLMV
jgi:dienelactone hydrolase